MYKINDIELKEHFLTLEDFKLHIGSLGNLYGWGNNSSEELGFTMETVTTPTLVNTNLSWINLSSYGVISAGVTIDGYIWLIQNSPYRLDFGKDWIKALCGSTHFIAMKNDNTLWSWGENTYGQLGLGSTTPVYSPIKIGVDTWSSYTTGTNSVLAIKSNGTLWGWGDGANYVLGIGSITDYSTPIQIGIINTWKQVSMGLSFSAGITTDNKLYTWGAGTGGQLGLGNIFNRSNPIQVGILTDWKQVSCGGSGNCSAVKTDGTLWTWGDNTWGQLGLGDLVNRSSPVQVGSLTNWSQVRSKQGFTLAIKTDGTLWSWGYNIFGQLGLGNTSSKSSPVQVGVLTNWKYISESLTSIFAHAIK